MADYQCYENFLAESIAPLILRCIGEFNYLMAPVTTFGKNILPRVAEKLVISQLIDIIEVVDEKNYRRLIYTGNPIVTACLQDRKQVITVSSTAFSLTVITAQSILIRKIAHIPLIIFKELRAQDRPELSSAEIVISGGRRLQSKENFKRLINAVD